LEQHQPSNLYNFSTTNLRNVINVGRDAHNVIIARQQECIEVEAYSPTNYHIPQEYLSSTWKHKLNSPDALDARMEQSDRGKTTLSLQECFEKALHSYFPWHPSATHSAFKCYQLQRALGAPPFKGVRRRTAKKGDGTTRAMIYA
jgi:hypothetical protein